MIYKKCEEYELYGFGVFIPRKHYLYILKYKKKVKPVCEWFVKRDYSYPEDKGMRMHITIKHLGYHRNYSNSQIECLFPSLIKISKKHLPIEIKARGIKLWLASSYISISLNLYPKKKLISFHNDVLKYLGSRIDFFEDIDGKNYDPHVTLGIAPRTKKNLKFLRRVEKESRNDKEVRIKLIQPYVFLKNKGPIALY